VSEIGDDFKALREVHRAYVQRVLPERQAEILALRERGYDVVERDDGYCFRIDRMLDLYPVHRRYHFIPTNKRGGYGSTTPLQICERFLRRTNADRR
jgi:hypothetical protein